jgi:hypothetical protein
MKSPQFRMSYHEIKTDFPSWFSVYLSFFVFLVSRVRFPARKSAVLRTLVYYSICPSKYFDHCSKYKMTVFFWILFIFLSFNSKGGKYKSAPMLRGSKPGPLLGFPRPSVNIDFPFFPPINWYFDGVQFSDIPLPVLKYDVIHLR